MFTLNARKVLIYSFVLELLLFHAFAEARLVRGGGRGTFSDSANNDYYLIDNLYINSVGIAADFVATQALSKNSEAPALLTTPSDCMSNRGSSEDYTFEVDNGYFVEEPCYYEFYENESRLILNGFSPFAFDLAHSAQISWTISQLGKPDLILNQDINAFNNGDILLDVLMPAELVPGEYKVDLDITLFSGPDADFYYDSSGEGNSFQYECNQDTDVCGYTSFYNYDTLSFSARFEERLIILPEQVVAASEPAIITLILLGAFGFRPRKQYFGSRSLPS